MRPTTRRVTVAALVIAPIVLAVVVSVAIGSTHPYPGVALGSGFVLEVERALALWVTWLLALVVGDQALQGRLPDEISGRGVKYADAGRVDDAQKGLDRSIRDVLLRVDFIESRLPSVHGESVDARDPGA